MRTLIINKDWPKVSVLYTDPTLIIKNLCREFSSDIACDYVENDFEDILMILQPAVSMTADTIRDLISAGIPAKLKSGNDTVAIFMPLSYHSRIDTILTKNSSKQSICLRRSLSAPQTP